MTEGNRDNLVLFPKTLDFYQIQLTRMLETERYGDAGRLLAFLLQCRGEAERHYTEWQALLGWLEAAFPESMAVEDDSDVLDGEGDDEAVLTEHAWYGRRVRELADGDTGYVPQLIAGFATGDPEQQMLALGQFLHLEHPDIEPALRKWLSEEEAYPPLQFRALQALRKQGAIGPVGFRREGAVLTVEAEVTPLAYEEFPDIVLQVPERVRQSEQVSDPTLAYFAEEMWKEFVQSAYGTAIYKGMTEEADSVADLWAAALHQLLEEKLHGKLNDEALREQYGTTGEIRFRYEQALRWLRQYALEPRPIVQ